MLQTDLQANISLEFWNAISSARTVRTKPQCLLLLLDASVCWRAAWIPTCVV